MTADKTASTDDELRAAFDKQLGADLAEIEALKGERLAIDQAITEKQEKFKRRYAPVLAALEKA
jgi:hypothetical protein